MLLRHSVLHNWLAISQSGGFRHMTKIAFLSTLLVAVLVCLLPAAPAQAQATRTFVSATGSDSDNCINVATPCRHFAAAFAATANNGEIYVLDPANYGSLTITHAVSIQGHGWGSVAPVANSAAITINAGSSDLVSLSGLTLDGTAITTTNGIVFNSGGGLIVQDSVVRNFTQHGIMLHAGSAPVSISDTIVSNNEGNGIVFQPSAAATLMVERVQAIGNGLAGFLMEGGVAPSGAIVAGAFADCVASENFQGVFGDGFPGAANLTFTIANCKIANNTNVGLVSSGSTVLLAQSTLTNNSAFSYFTQSSGIIESFGNNNISGLNNGPLTPIAQQ
jgi:Right handed beta helix region